VAGASSRSAALTSSSVMGDNSVVLAGRDASEIGSNEDGVSSLTDDIVVTYTNNMPLLLQRIWCSV